MVEISSRRCGFGLTCIIGLSALLIRLFSFIGKSKACFLELTLDGFGLLIEYCDVRLEVLNLAFDAFHAVIQQLVNHFDNVLQARVLADIGLHEVRVFQSKIREHYCFNSLDFLRRVMHRFDDREHVLLNII